MSPLKEVIRALYVPSILIRTPAIWQEYRMAEYRRTSVYLWTRVICLQLLFLSHVRKCIVLMFFPRSAGRFLNLQTLTLNRPGNSLWWELSCAL